MIIMFLAFVVFRKFSGICSVQEISGITFPEIFMFCMFWRKKKFFLHFVAFYMMGFDLCRTHVSYMCRKHVSGTLKVKGVMNSL